MRVKKNAGIFWQGEETTGELYIIPVLVEAVKTLNAKVDKLEAENAELKKQNAEIADMKKQIAAILETLKAKQDAPK